MAPTLTRAQARLRAADTPQLFTIREATHSRSSWTIETEEGTGFAFSHDKLNGTKPPKAGDAIALYTINYSTIRGVDLRGEPLFYKTDAELDAEHEEWRAKHKADKRKRFEKDRRRLDREFAALPEVFQRRISWFRANQADWRWEHEAYEMACCVDAVKLAEAMRTPKGVERFRKASYKKQREMAPELSDDHSGNTFGMTIRLAWLYLTEPLAVIAEHGAITPLVGCDGCGCAHPRPADVEEVIDRLTGRKGGRNTHD